jgi:NAD(P)-dependent dehydrogenase (short-subunit alcohol dehydrogenase family)
MVGATPRRTALVTGGARRIGRAIALELAGAGFDIAVHYRSSHAEALEACALLERAGATAAAFGADLADEAQCAALVPQVVARFGRLDAVVNNASTFEYDDVAGFTHASLRRHVDANTAPAIVLARALHRHALERGGAGCVVNLLDQKLANPNPDYFSYTLSKAALEAATTMLAMALAPVLRVAAVAPGITLTSGSMTESEFARAHAMTPLRGGATTDDIARAVRFIVESPAVTGTTLLVDGGQHLLAQPRDVLFAAREGA